MIRVSEIVLAGHPDKFCDQIADAVIERTVEIDPDAYGQVEVSVWSDQVWLSGAVCTRRPLESSIEEIVMATAESVGYCKGNWIDSSQYKVHNTVCQYVKDPGIWSDHVNDQAVIIGWAGYDEKTRYLPPEHYVLHHFREALTMSFKGGLLDGQGPDGKLVVILKEENSTRAIEQILITLQQQTNTEYMAFCIAVEKTLKEAYAQLQDNDPRWSRSWQDINLLINPNGPFVEGGSDGDSGQTGRKLVMDYYGPRIPIGGGALSGKHLSHIDRIGAYTARQAAVEAVKSGAEECQLRLTYAPNTDRPIDLVYDMVGRGHKQMAEYFSHQAMIKRYRDVSINQTMARGRHFYDEKLPWNHGC